MLPPALSEQLCSLVPGQERLTFSIVFTMTKEAKVVKKWFGKTVIRCVRAIYCSSAIINTAVTRSAAKLSYQDAQNVIEGRVLGDVTVTPEHNAADIEHDIRNLEGLAKKLRTQRFEKGTLSLESLRLAFVLDENGTPTDCGQYRQTDANSLIKEVRASSLSTFEDLMAVLSSSCCSAILRSLNTLPYTFRNKLYSVVTTIRLSVEL